MNRILKVIVLILILPLAPVLDVLIPTAIPRLEIWKTLWDENVS